MLFGSLNTRLNNPTMNVSWSSDDGGICVFEPIPFFVHDPVATIHPFDISCPWQWEERGKKGEGQGKRGRKREKDSEDREEREEREEREGEEKKREEKKTSKKRRTKSKPCQH